MIPKAQETKLKTDKLDFIKIRNFILQMILSRKMVMDVNQTYCGDHFTMYTNIEPLCCAPETNIMLYVNDTSKKKCNKKIK